MPTRPESPRMTYRAARRAFIAACEKAHIDTVARLHPSKGPDGKPLFMDCAAMGPRQAARAVLVVGHDATGTDLLIRLLGAVSAPKEARLVLVHAFDPALFAGAKSDPAWPSAMLGAVATEDLLCSGRSIDAAQALAIGLVQMLADDPVAAALAYFDEHLAPRSAAALAHAMQAVRAPRLAAMRDELARVERLYLQSLMKTRDANEGLAAFLAKRSPTWEHR